MDIALTLLLIVVAWHALRVRYQREHIKLLGGHLASLQLEKHMETLTQGYTRAIHEESAVRQLQVLETFAAPERAVGSQVQRLAEAMQQEPLASTSMGVFSFCVPYIERILPSSSRDFRRLLQIHAEGIREVVDNPAGWDLKERAFHLSAELYLLQHSCHWFCKSKAVADARLVFRHQVNHQKVLESTSASTRLAYQKWIQG